MPEPLRVLHLAKLAPTEHGGIETVVGELLDAIPRQRQPVTLDCYCYAARSSDEQLGPAVTLRRRRTTAVVASAPISLALLRSYRRARRDADLVHVHLPNPWAAVLILALPTRAAVVASVHAASSRYGPLRRPHDALMRRLFSRADAIAVSAAANAALFELEAHRDKVTVIPYGIDPARLQPPDDHPQTTPASRPPRVLFVGRLVYYKGLDTLLDAAPAINAELVLLGDGPLYPRLRAKVDAMGLTDKVRFIRDADDATLAAHLADSALFVLPSTTTSESFGVSVLEAMAAGKPVVVTNLGTGLDHLVRTTGAGRVVPPGDATALADTINDLLADPSERARLGAIGREALDRDYTSDRMAQRTLDLYAKAAAVKTPDQAASR
ncbi:MAG TPA: glycosyltransferase [Mycobacteriales bacterium]|nr:glycosyltransferase [Mycobacteriales bacterium]